MRRFFTSLFIVMALMAGALSFIGRADAQVTSGLTGVGETVKLSSTDPRIIATRIINISLGLIGIILVSLIVYAGFLYMTSGGEAEKTSKAKKIIISAIIGLIIILSSWAIAKFLIEKIWGATNGGTNVNQTGGAGGGLSTGGYNVFQVTGLTPTGYVENPNVEPKIFFSERIDDTSENLARITVTKLDGTPVAGQVILRTAASIKFIPTERCAQDASRFCFVPFGDYVISVDSNFKAADGDLINCGGFVKECKGIFRVGDKLDTQGPTVTFKEPFNSVPIDQSVNLIASAKDNSGVSNIDFYHNGEFLESSVAVGETSKYFEGSYAWSTAGLEAKSIQSLKAQAFDVDSNDGQTEINVIALKQECFDGIKNLSEEGIDCGGPDCLSCTGSTCTENIQCQSGICDAQTQTCIAQPIIVDVSPSDGKSGTFVTVRGYNFGTNGTITFLGGPGLEDDVIAQPPIVCQQAGATLWSANQAIVEVPESAHSGPLMLINADSHLSDSTDTGDGPVLDPFLVNDTVYPGLCAVRNGLGYVGDKFTAVGKNFGNTANEISFGRTVLTSFPEGWSDEEINGNVPVVGTGNNFVKVKTGDVYSNPVNYIVQDVSAGPPIIAEISPNKGPKKQYITLTGSNFGAKSGTVKFTNLTSGQVALGDTDFPDGCSESFWTDSQVIVKVPSQFLADPPLSTDVGDYSIHLETAEVTANSSSNKVQFTLNEDVLTPGICAISPYLGPIMTPVTLYGEGFGGEKGAITFYNKIDSVPNDNWKNTEVSTAVPSGALTGPVVVTAQTKESNGINFQVRNCNEKPGLCGAGQCCPSGACVLGKESCGLPPPEAMFAWRTSTGLIPLAPDVIEQCLPESPQPPLPSPAPWIKRQGGDSACVSSKVTMRFTTKLDETTVVPVNFRFKKCLNETCTESQNVAYKTGPSNMIQLVNDGTPGSHAVILEPVANLDPSSTYLVEVLTNVKGFGVGGDFMVERAAECGQGVGYCFRFRTRSSTEACKVGAISMAPQPYELHSEGATVDYLASPLSIDDKCVVLKCDNYDWSWEHGVDNSNDHADFVKPLVTNQAGKITCKQKGVAKSESGDIPVQMIAKTEGKTGIADLYIRFIPPRVVDYAPKCQEACVNAKIWAKFNSELWEPSLTNNVEIRPCKNENCFELGAPILIPSNLIKMGNIDKNSDKPVYLTIEPKTTDNKPLLSQGTYYQVLLKGGTDAGIKGSNKVVMDGLNHPQGFAWTFRTKIGEDAFCEPDRVDMAPLLKYETQIGARQLFTATPYSKPDLCSQAGQALIQSSSFIWDSKNKAVADYYRLTDSLLDTGGALPDQCGAMCLFTGAQASYGKTAVCGNGKIETTDPVYCKNFSQSYKYPVDNSNCVVLQAGSKDSEQCDPEFVTAQGEKVFKPNCNPTTCLWDYAKPVTVDGGGSCGNGSVDLGETCDYGSFCMGAPTSSTPETWQCTIDNYKICFANGGQCKPKEYRGCSENCLHLGSAVAGSTCGNGDVADGEDCDDGNISNNDGCSSACLHTGSTSISKLKSVCGNGVLEAGETCEKPSLAGSLPAGCSAQTCLNEGTLPCDNDPLTPSLSCCGNGGEPEVGEDCDDSNKMSGDGCSAVCLFEGASAGYQQPSFCGDGLLGTGEQCEAGAGDGLIDGVQLAQIIGDADPDETGKMSSELSATLDKKEGTSTYGLQCGFTEEMICETDLNPSGYGLTDKGCCSLRPELTYVYPTGGSKNVCRNIEISFKFNSKMNVGSVVNNFQIAKEVLNTSCPEGSQQVTKNFEAVSPGIRSWFSNQWKRLLAWVTGNPAYAGIWCSGSVGGSLSTRTPTSTSDFVYLLTNALDANTNYTMRFMGDTDLFNNSILANRVGMKTAKGVVMDGMEIWTFRTGSEICAVNAIKVTDTHPDHPLLFVQSEEQHNFIAQAMSLQHGIAIPILPVFGYEWIWSPWTTSASDIVIANSLSGTMAVVEAANKNGTAFVEAKLAVFKDTYFVPSTVDKTVSGSVPVTVELCANPWPNLKSDTEPIAPFRDKQSTDGLGKDSSLVNSPFVFGPYFNFSTTYCRDAGTSSSEDDLPKLKINFVPQNEEDKKEGILRQYLFTYEDAALKKDAIGIRIAANPLHLSPTDWYNWRGFGGSPQSIIVDGYRALKDGTTTYVAAANTEDVNEYIYSNIYLISHNPDASPVTVGIYDQLVANLFFNINLTKDVSNVCVYGSEYGIGATYLKDGKPVACSADYDCQKETPSGSIHCASYKLKLARDSVRISDFQLMSRAIEDVKEKQGQYPKLEGGTYLRGLTTSRWPSWAAELSRVTGVEMPVDPVNAFLSCGVCSKSKNFCMDKSACEKDEECVSDPDYGIMGSFDPSLCWDSAKFLYMCPQRAGSPSRIYQYSVINNGYQLASEFEIPKADANAKWWRPELTTEVKRCVNNNSGKKLDTVCTTDADCRDCANPQDSTVCPIAEYPITANACQPVGGRLVYQDVCTSAVYGQAGVCGDGVIAFGQEICEVGQTKIADCKTSSNENGLKLQVCSNCKEYTDDPNITKCDAGLSCGNGRVDRKCIGGPRDGLSCLREDDCPDVFGNSSTCGATSEICDDGVLNGTYGHCSLKCDGYASYCGDNMISPGELCDRGSQNGQYCTADCGNLSQNCSLNCKEKGPYCGDGLVSEPEQCDGETATTALGICLAGTNKDKPCENDVDCGLNGKCATADENLGSCADNKESRCATQLRQCLPPDGTIEAANYISSDYTVCDEDSDCAEDTICRPIREYVMNCTNAAQCTYVGKAGGVIPGECYTYPTAHVRSCNAAGLPQSCNYSSWSSCQVLNICGDGITDSPAEECDDGFNNGDNKACTSTCRKNVCGDGKTYSDVEECDNGLNNGKLTCSADYSSTCASCSTKCKFQTSSGGYCGDGIKNGGEQCDGMKPIHSSFTSCPYTNTDLAAVCSYLGSACLKAPCQKTSEIGVTCKTLGYDFATNGMNPKLKALDPALELVNKYCFSASGNSCAQVDGCDCDLTSHQTATACEELDGVPEYLRVAAEACLGLKCNITPNGGYADGFNVEFIKPTASLTSNEFWQCIREKGPSLNVGIETDDVPEMLQCGLKCGFTGCSRCSDEAGTAVVRGQLIDSIYNQVIPGAKVSLFYKGILVSQSSTDEDGKYEIVNLNDRPECSLYKLVVEKYDDNPCTGKESNRPNCGAPQFPEWPYSFNVKENERGGYWPLTTPSFQVGNYSASVINQISEDGVGQILIFPRPGPGEGYLTVIWKGWDAEYHPGGFTTHVVMPSGHTVPTTDDTLKANYPDSFTPTTCAYDLRPATNDQTGTVRQCVRDITWPWNLKGFGDMSRLPYAQLVCLHKAGDIVGNLPGNSVYNGCPVEGRDACYDSHGFGDPNDVANMTQENADICSNGFAVQKICIGDPNKPDGTPCGGGDGNTCNGECVAPCGKTFWDECNFYKDGPISTYFRYAAYSGFEQPIKLFWNYDQGISVNGNLNNPALTKDVLKNHLKQYKYKAIIATDKEILTVTSDQLTEDCGKNCKFWHIADIQAKYGTIVVHNKLRKGRDAENFTDGIATYEPDFQGDLSAKDYCVANNSEDRLYKQCSSNADCAPEYNDLGVFMGLGLTCKKDVEYDNRAKANY